MMNDISKPVPEVGKEYHFWDDGKSSPSRHYICKCERILKTKKEAEVLSSLWTVHNEHYHIGKKPDGSQRIIMIDKMTHHCALKSLKANVELTKLKYFTIQINESLLNEAYKVLNDEEFTKKYDLDYIEKKSNLKKVGQNSSKKIKDLETGTIYESATECANAIGKSNSYISKHKERFVSIK